MPNLMMPGHAKQNTHHLPLLKVSRSQQSGQAQSKQKNMPLGYKLLSAAQKSNDKVEVAWWK
jgi:hypothetical protein